MRIIKKIEIRHFRSIHDETLEDIKSFNIFGGTNDSGKSNILRALNLFFNGETSFLTKFDFAEDYSKLALLEAREKKKGRQFISIKIFFNVDAIEGKSELKKLVRQNDELWVKREWWKYEEMYRETLPDFITGATQGIKRSFSVLLSSLRFIYIPAFKNHEVFSHVLSLAGNEEGIFIDQRAKDTLNTQIATSAAQLEEDFSGLTKINTRVSLPITLDSFWAALDVATEFRRAKEKETKRGLAEDYLIDLIARGEGIKSIFTPIVLGWLARKIEGRYWIWGIDEPENSLESAKTVALFKKFTDYSKNAQIFVSSHSPVFIFPKSEDPKINITSYIATQEREGETKYRAIDVSNPDLREALIKDFGVDYGTFLKTQEEYAENLREAQAAKEAVQEKLRKITQPVIFVEGELDEAYFNKAVEVFRDGTYSARICWIGAKRNDGTNPFFTGCKALDHFANFASANQDFIKKKVVLLYDVDINKTRKETENLLVLSPQRKTGSHFKKGSENLLVFPEGFDYNSFITTQEKIEGDKEIIIREPDKKKLCDYVCKKLPPEKQKEFLGNINDILTSLESFFTRD